jgi:hypothetical protein
MFQTKVVQQTKTHILCSIFFSKKFAVHEIMWKNTGESDRPQITMWCMCTACWILNDTNALSSQVILIAFPLQKWFHECATMLCSIYTASLVITCYMQLLQSRYSL